MPGPGRLWTWIVAAAAILSLGVILVLLVGLPGGSSTVRLSARDSGGTIHAQVGQQVMVSLTQKGGYGPWTHAASSDTTVLQPAADNTVPVRRVARALFRAVQIGQVRLTAEAPAECEPTPCAQPPAAFSVTVIVDR